MSDASKIMKYLRRNTKVPGVTPAKLSKLTGIPKEAIYKRVHDLRMTEGVEIYSNYRLVKGKRTMYYRIAS